MPFVPRVFPQPGLLAVPFKEFSFSAAC